MHLKRLRVENFRALDNINVEFDARISVIIGPNAIGKTTILEAIRIAKGLLAPRTQQETNQILLSLGAISPHLPRRLLNEALTNRPSLPLVVQCTYQLGEEEITQIKSLAPQLGIKLAQQNAGLAFAAPAQVVAYLSSPMGQQALMGANSILSGEITKVEASKRLELNLTISFQTGQISGEFPVQQILFAALEQALAPDRSLFSYFRAARVLPTGEQPVQLGIADSANQLESYNSQPQLKYQRLKSTIFNSIIRGTPDGQISRSSFSSSLSASSEAESLGRSESTIWECFLFRSRTWNRALNSRLTD